MELTLNVKITGLENLVSVLERLALLQQPEATTAPNQQIIPRVETPVAQEKQVPTVSTMIPIQPQILITPTEQQMGTQVASTATQQAVPITAVPIAQTSYTQNQLALAATTLVDAGRLQEVQSLVASFGVSALTQLPPEQYGNFATQLRALGAKI